MTVLQIYAFFVLPLVVLGLGMTAYFWFGRDTPEAGKQPGKTTSWSLSMIPKSWQTFRTRSCGKTKRKKARSIQPEWIALQGRQNNKTRCAGAPAPPTAPFSMS